MLTISLAVFGSSILWFDSRLCVLENGVQNLPVLSLVFLAVILVLLYNKWQNFPRIRRFIEINKVELKKGIRVGVIPKQEIRETMRENMELIRQMTEMTNRNAELDIARCKEKFKEIEETAEFETSQVFDHHLPATAIRSMILPSTVNWDEEIADVRATKSAGN